MNFTAQEITAGACSLDFLLDPSVSSRVSETSMSIRSGSCMFQTDLSRPCSYTLDPEVGSSNVLGALRDWVLVLPKPQGILKAMFPRGSKHRRCMQLLVPETRPSMDLGTRMLTC